MSRPPRRPLSFALRTLVTVSAGLLLAACSDTTTPGSDGTNPNGNNNNNNGTTKIPCLNGSLNLDCSAKIGVTDEVSQPIANASVQTVQAGNVAQGGELPIKVIIRNTAADLTAAALKITKVELLYGLDYGQGPEENDDNGYAFECWNGDATKRCKDTTWKSVVPAAYKDKGATQEEVFVKFKRFDDKNRKAILRISYQNVTGANSFQVQFVTAQGSPKALVIPSLLAFPYVGPGKCETQPFTISNGGDGMLVINNLNPQVDGTVSVKLTDPADLDTECHQGGKLWELPSPLSIPPGGTAKLEAKFCPVDDKGKGGKVLLGCNDPVAQELVIEANTKVPCIQANPQTLDFGGVLVGSPATKEITLKSCGPVQIDVTSIEQVAPLTTGDFAFDWSKAKDRFKDPAAAAAPGFKGPSVDNPLQLAPSNANAGGKDSAQVQVTYSPDKVDEAFDTSTVEIKSNAYVVPKVNLKGQGVNQVCPIAVVTVQEGEEVVPQTLLHLNGAKSKAPGGGTIKKYKWTVKQPSGSNQPLAPNATFPNPTLQANASGEYEFCLDVWDDKDAKSCQPTCVTVVVVPNNAIHVELLWDTPADPDQTDSGPAAGADLDLHFANLLATGLDLDCDGAGDPWFSNPWDAFWFNPTPNWGSAQAMAEDDPTLDLDDTDGAGPENLNLVNPEGTITDPIYYSVGVHYWNDHGYGSSFATVAIYIQGALSVYIPKVKMDVLDMWFVGKINWPNTVTGGAKDVFTPCFQTGEACKGGKMWVPKGDRCITKCYENKAFTAANGGAAPAACKKP